jgi:hypothetical protein
MAGPKVRIWRKEDASKSLTVLSEHAAANNLLSGLKTTEEDRIPGTAKAHVMSG